MQINNYSEKNLDRAVLGETYHVVPFFSNGHLVRVKTKDNVLLHGFLNEPEQKSDRVFLYIAGAATNFYKGTKNPYLESAALANGYNYLTVNTRGRDEFTAYEIFSDCLLDLDIWLDFCQAKEYKEVIICGDSYGSLKVVYYLTEKEPKIVSTIMLLAPADMVGRWKKFVGGKTQEYLDLSRQMIQQRKELDLMPQESYHVEYYRKISAKTYYDRYGSESKIHIFDFHNPQFDFDRVKGLKLPTLVVVGSADDYVPNPKESMQRLENVNSNIEAKVIEGADHHFTGKEEELKKIIQEWLKENR